MIARLLLSLLLACGASAVRKQSAKSVAPKPGFPAYSQGDEISMSWDGRSLYLNGERSIFLSGSLHGPRASPETWETVLDAAVST